MKFRALELSKSETEKIGPVNQCIYCGISNEDLTDEHIIPYAISGNSAILLKSSCTKCARIIQIYEQNVLRNQLGQFRYRIQAPSRNKRNRPTHQYLDFIEVNRSLQAVRNLGKRKFRITDLPISLSVWNLCPPRILGEQSSDADHFGHPWVSIEENLDHKLHAIKIARQVARETKSEHVAIKVNTICRDDFLRFLAKTAHAFAIFELGLGSFKPTLQDIILNKSHNLDMFIGGTELNPLIPYNPSNTIELTVGTVGFGPAKGYTAVYIRLYPILGTPPHIVIVGQPH